MQLYSSYFGSLVVGSLVAANTISHNECLYVIIPKKYTHNIHNSTKEKSFYKFHRLVTIRVDKNMQGSAPNAHKLTLLFIPLLMKFCMHFMQKPPKVIHLIHISNCLPNAIIVLQLNQQHNAYLLPNH
jgi:hypothetical protein